MRIFCNILHLTALFFSTLTSAVLLQLLRLLLILVLPLPILVLPLLLMWALWLIYVLNGSR